MPRNARVDTYFTCGIDTPIFSTPAFDASGPSAAPIRLVRSFALATNMAILPSARPPDTRFMHAPAAVILFRRSSHRYYPPEDTVLIFRHDLLVFFWHTVRRMTNNLSPIICT